MSINDIKELSIAHQQDVQDLIGEVGRLTNILTTLSSSASALAIAIAAMANDPPPIVEPPVIVPPVVDPPPVVVPPVVVPPVPPLAKFPSGLNHRSGFRMAQNTASSHAAGQVAVTNWRKREPDIGSTFMGEDMSWNDLTSNWVHTIISDSIKAGKWKMWSIAIPLVTKESPRKYAEAARGDFDKYHIACAKNLAKSLGSMPVVIRLGWEADHGYPWSWIDKENKSQDGEAGAAIFKKCWNHIGGIYKTYLPGALLDINVLRDCVRPLGVWAPEAADIISVDTYDSFTGTFYVDDPAKFMGTYDPSTGWAKGPRGVALLAKARGKLWAVPEWGVTNQAFSASSKANNPDFIRAMFALFKEFESNLYYEVYFQGSSKVKYHDIMADPYPSFNAKASVEYLRLYRP